MNYPAPIVAEAISPVRGMPAKFKFPPRISEIKEYLDSKLPREPERAYPLFLPEPEVDRSQRLSYDELRAKYGDNWGLAAKKSKKPLPFPSADELRAQIGDEAWGKIPNAKTSQG